MCFFLRGWVPNSIGFPFTSHETLLLGPGKAQHGSAPPPPGAPTPPGFLSAGGTVHSARDPFHAAADRNNRRKRGPPVAVLVIAVLSLLDEFMMLNNAYTILHP